MNLKRLWREPLLHFLAAGLVLFGVFSLMHEGDAPGPSDRTIVVDNDSLLNFLQYRSKAFQPEFFAAQLEAMAPAERADLVKQYVEEEMLYREAKSLGLQEGDYVIRQRLVQKMRFLLDDVVETGDTPTDAVLSDYLQNNKELYAIEPSVTFTHVFLDRELHGDASARQQAEQMRIQLNTIHAAFEDATRFGDRFPFLDNYVERTFEYVGSHFGSGFAAELERAEPSQARWIGPIRSDHGYHVVLLTQRSEARLPDLQEVRAQVEEDWKRDRLERARSQSLGTLAGQYMIERKDLEPKSK